MDEPKHKDKNFWENELDAKKHLLEIHDDTVVLGREFKKSRLTDKEKELIINMLPAAQLAIDLCPNKITGREIATMDLHVINALPIINFNHPTNHVLNRYTQWEPAEEDRNDDENYLGKMLERMKSDIKPVKE